MNSKRMLTVRLLASSCRSSDPRFKRKQAMVGKVYQVQKELPGGWVMLDYLLFRVEDTEVVSVTNPNNCLTCDYYKIQRSVEESPDYDGKKIHCYMFKDEPFRACALHTEMEFPVFSPGSVALHVSRLGDRLSVTQMAEWLASKPEKDE